MPINDSSTGSRSSPGDDYPAAHSMDTSWYAVDAAGHVALFISSENGHAPRNAENSYYLDDLYRAEHPDHPDDWQGYEQLAEEFGLFVYNYGDSWDPIDTYQRLIGPSNPVHVEQLPPAIRLGCKKIRFPGVRFADAERVQPLEFGPCGCWDEDERVAYVAADGVTVRPIRGKERHFPDFVRRVRETWPDVAARYRFEGNDD
jgi:hypothetical protein